MALIWWARITPTSSGTRAFGTTTTSFQALLKRWYPPPLMCPRLWRLEGLCLPTKAACWSQSIPKQVACVLCSLLASFAKLVKPPMVLPGILWWTCQGEPAALQVPCGVDSFVSSRDIIGWDLQGWSLHLAVVVSTGAGHITCYICI